MAVQDQYQQALAACSRIAHQEFDCVGLYFARCDKIVAALKKELRAAVVVGGKAMSRKHAQRDSLQDMLDTLGDEYSELKAKRKRNLTKHKRGLCHFNVMLFGRTMAGKSTIREAITRGNGATIGKGAQRTTRDVREYEWNNLRIIDTPGFGAYNGEEDAQIAHEILERSDVVLFMLNSDSIQESTFSELLYVQRLNKPLIFVLNMKKDLENEGNRRRALRDPGKYVYKADDIAGHRDRLEKLAARAGMRTDAITIIQIHAQAAFLATKTLGEEGEKLHQFSQLDTLLAALQAEVSCNGPVRRIQTFLDSALHHIDQQEALIGDQRGKIASLMKEYENSLVRVSSWKQKKLRDAPALIASEVDKAFKLLVDSVAGFVDDHIEDKHAAAAWDSHVKRYSIESRIGRTAQAVMDDVVHELEEFHRELKESLDLEYALDVECKASHFSKTDYKRINGWGSAISGVIGAIAFANSWNPVGWAFAGLGLLFGIFSWLSDSRAKKLAEAKRGQRASITDDIEKNKDKIKKSLLDWFEEQVHLGTIVPVEARLQQLCVSLTAFLDTLDRAERELEQLRHDINHRLLHQVAAVVTGQHFALPRMKKIVRAPGYACYFLTSEQPKSLSLLTKIGAALGEKVLAVRDGSMESKVAFLYRGLVERIDVDHDGNVVLQVKKDNMGKVLGKSHRRIQMAAGLCSTNIEIFAI
ncbi:MAG: 50S ribosome-binding GTPase [Gammaproteobacteria bacterium]|nr:50S ribosome-binding GTPase [Gammaproteobacteria bacterium]